MNALTLQIAAMRLEAQGVVSLELRSPEGQALPAWEPGAHIDLLLPSGSVRQYSLCGEVEDRLCLRIAVLLDAKGRGGSREVHEGLRVGQLLQVRGPRNAFALRPHGRYLFVAGGIGITPLLPMLRAAGRAGAQWQLIYGGRTRASMAFAAELLRAHGPERVQLRPADEGGPLDLGAIVDQAAAGAQVYSCGPAPLLDALGERFAAAGLQHHLHIERFAAAPVVTDAAAGSLRVILARSGAQVEVAPDCSILAALRAAGHAVSSSCEQGICGMCETRVLDGVPEHRDMLLTESERARGDVMMLCVSRARTPSLTLDL